MSRYVAQVPLYHEWPSSMKEHFDRLMKVYSKMSNLGPASNWSAVFNYTVARTYNYQISHGLSVFRSIEWPRPMEEDNFFSHPSVWAYICLSLPFVATSLAIFALIFVYIPRVCRHERQKILDDIQYAHEFSKKQRRIAAACGVEYVPPPLIPPADTYAMAFQRWWRRKYPRLARHYSARGEGGRAQCTRRRRACARGGGRARRARDPSHAAIEDEEAGALDSRLLHPQRTAYRYISSRSSLPPLPSASPRRLRRVHTTDAMIEIRPPLHAPPDVPSILITSSCPDSRRSPSSRPLEVIDEERAMESMFTKICSEADAAEFTQVTEL